MLLARRKRGNTSNNPRFGWVRLLLLAAAALCVILAVYGGDDHTGSSRSVLSDDESARNIQLAAEQRFEHSQECTQATARAMFRPPPSLPRASNTNAVVPLCDFTFLDLGANVGDSLGKFIDVGIPDCSNNTSLFANYDVRSATVRTHDKARPNRLTRWMRDMLDTASTQLGTPLAPEHYCYVGVEGNPTFTARLQQQQARLLASKPRPVRHVQFLTETVATATQGEQVTLYLDTTNVEQNFWGSSIYASHPDASTSDGSGVPVTGESLSHLITTSTRRTVGNHLLIKMDIEGAEYVVMNEAYPVLCQYAEAAVRVDVMIETHPKSTLPEDQQEAYDSFMGQVRHRLHGCGVNLKTVKDAGRR